MIEVFVSTLTVNVDIDWSLIVLASCDDEYYATRAYPFITSVRIKLVLSVKAVEYSCTCQSSFYFHGALCVNITECSNLVMLLLLVALETASTSMDSQASEFIQVSPFTILTSVILLLLRIQIVAMDLASI